MKLAAYWVCTGLTGLAFAAGGVMDLMRSPQMLEGMAHLGYPPYFVTILGVWKILGALAIFVPAFAVLKEWAYAGMMFDLTGAAVSHLVSGDDIAHIITPLILAVVVVGSWWLRPANRRLT